MLLLRILPWMFIIIHRFCECGFGDCQHKLMEEKPAHRCDVSNENILSDTSAELRICKTECIHRANCRFLSYNTKEWACLLGQIACSLVPDDQSYVAFIRTKADVCLRWVPSSKQATGTVVCYDATCSFGYVGRLKANSHLLPGSVIDDTLLTVLKGKVFLFEAAEPKEVLYVLDGCEVAWVFFKAGDALPVDAVAGGYLSTGDDIPLYVIREDVGNGYDYGFGYYDPTAKMGHTFNAGAGQCTQMEMLVLI